MAVLAARRVTDTCNSDSEFRQGFKAPNPDNVLKELQVTGDETAKLQFGERNLAAYREAGKNNFAEQDVVIVGTEFKGIYSLEVSVSSLATRFDDKGIFGSIPNLSTFFLERYFQKEAFAIEDCKTIAAHFILMGAVFDSPCVGGLDMALLPNGGSVLKLGYEEINDLRKQSEFIDKEFRRLLRVG